MIGLKKTCATFSTNQMQNQNQSRIGRTRFPALGAGYVYLLQALIGSFLYLRLLWLAIVITLVLVLWHLIENRSNSSRLYKRREDELREGFSVRHDSF